jgi:hypothetical protein
MDFLKPAPDPQPNAAVPAWTASADGMSCPNNHHVAQDHLYCPQCALPVPGFIKAQAQQLHLQRHDKVSLGLLR